MKPPDVQPPALIFDWKRREFTAPWLLGYLLLTALGFALLFLIFRIVTPEAPKLTSRPQQMIVLNPAVPAERALIHRAMDQSFTLLPTESPITHEMRQAARLPAFPSSLADFELKLKTPKSEITTRDQPRLLSQHLDILPPIEAPPPAPVTSKTASRLCLQMEGQLASRLLTPRTLSGIALSDPSHPVFHIAIGELGQVIMALPLSAAEDPSVMVKLHAAMTQLRFQPTGVPIEWAQVSFAWEKEAAP